MDPPDSLERLRRRLAEFARRRDWEQFHSPKNLAMALVGEAAEVVEHFQWLTERESLALPASKRQAVADELADVLIYLIHTADALDIDLIAAVGDKIARNEQRFATDRVKGDPRRASEYKDRKQI